MTTRPSRCDSGFAPAGAMAGGVFTGLVQTQGRLLARSPRSQGFRLALSHDFGVLELGESIAVNGVCLTVSSANAQQFEADASRETIARSTLGHLPIGQKLHLERALRVSDRLGGHIVAGHVDAITRLLEASESADGSELVFEQPASLRPYVAEKGSICLDGVSLTINRISEASFSVMIVPHSLASTHLGSLRRGDEVNVEVDVLARYVVHLVRLGTPASAMATSSSDEVAERDRALRDSLARAGFL